MTYNTPSKEEKNQVIKNDEYNNVQSEKDKLIDILFRKTNNSPEDNLSKKKELNVDDLLDKLEAKCQQFDDSKNDNVDVADTGDSVDDNVDVADTSDFVDDNVDVADTSDSIDDNVDVADTGDSKNDNVDVADTGDSKNDNVTEFNDDDFIDEEFIDEYDDEYDDYDFSVFEEDEEELDVEESSFADLEKKDNLDNESYDDEFNPYKMVDSTLVDDEDSKHNEEANMENVEEETSLEEKIVYSSCRALVPIGPLVDLPVYKPNDVNFEINPYYMNKKIKRNYKTLIISLSTLITFVIMIILVFVILKFLK